MTDKPIVTGIAHLGIRVHDLDRARAFYELLGYTFVAGPVGPEPVAILSHPQAPEITSSSTRIRPRRRTSCDGNVVELNQPPSCQRTVIQASSS